MNKGNYRGAFTECNSKQQNVFSLFSSPSQDDQCFGFLKGILQNAEEDNQQEYLYQRSGQIAAYQPKQKFSIQKRLFKDSDNQYNDISEDYRYEENSIAQNLGNNQQNIFDQKNVGQIFQHQRNLFGQQQQSSYGAYHHYAQTVYQEKQPEESRILNLNVKSSRNLMSSFQTINETQQQSCSEQDEEKFQSPTQIVSNQDSQRQAVYEKLQYQEKQCTQDSSFPNNVFNKRVLKNQYLSDYQLNQKASQSSSSSSNKKESLQQPHNNIFAQFQNQQNQYSVLKSQFPSSQHQQQQLIEINRYKGFQSKKGNEIVFQTQTQLSSASSQNQQSSNKENSQNTSHSSTSSSGLSGYTYSGDVQNQTNNSQDSSSSQKQSQYKNQMITSQKKLQQQLQKELNPKIFQMSHARLSAYQSNFVPLKQQQTIILPDNSKDQQNIIQKQISQANLEQKSQYTENVNKQAQAYSTSSSSLSSSKSQIQSSTHPSCSSPSSQSSCSSDAQNNLRNLSFSSSLKISLPSPSLATNQNQQTAQNVYNQNVTQGKSQKSLGSSGKKPFGKSKQPVYYEKQQVNTTQNLQFVEQQQSLPYQTPLKKECQSPSISSCQDDTYQNQYGFNSPLYTPNTVGKLHKIKETFYESTPINEFKQRFARKIKQLRQELKDNCKTPEGSQINVQSSCSSILQKEIKQKLSFVEILGTSIAKMSQIKPNIYWKLMFELADYAKKDCMYHEAKYFYKIAINLQPFCPDIWLEYAKMEEDYGNLQKAKEILENAYPFCKMSDSLILKLLRIIEKIGKIEDIRVILSNLNQLKIDKCWKIYIEGAFIEIRFGNIKNAERILKMLHSYLDLNGQVCYEYARVLELQGKYQQVIKLFNQPFVSPLDYNLHRFYSI